MHETAIVRELLAVALDAAAGAGSAKIRRVLVVVGGGTGVTEESVRFLFDVLGRGTAAEGAEVVVRVEPRSVTCRTCGRLGHDALEPVCPACGGHDLEVQGGMGCYLESIDVEDP